MKLICPYCNKEISYPDGTEGVDFEVDYRDCDSGINTYNLLLSVDCPHCHKSFEIREKYTLVDIEIMECEDED